MWVGYCDGGYKEGDCYPRRPERAGFGFAVVAGGDGGADAAAREVSTGCGPVVLDQDSPLFLGATRRTNNTAELSALTEMLLWLRRALRAGATCSTFIVRPDSMYAVDVATGEAHASANREMARELRMLWQEVAATLKGGLWREHVKGHSGHRWNDRVDALADQGALGEVGEQGGPWAAGQWPPEHGMHSTAARMVARVQRSVRVEREGCELVVRSTFHLGRLRDVAAGGELPYETPTLDAEQARQGLVRRLAGGTAGWVCDAPVLWLMRPGVGVAGATERAARLVAAGTGYELARVRSGAREAATVRAVRAVMRVLRVEAVEVGGAARPEARPAAAGESGYGGDPAARATRAAAHVAAVAREGKRTMATVVARAATAAAAKAARATRAAARAAAVAREC